MKQHLIVYTTLFLTVTALTGCKKLVETTPPDNAVNAANAYATDATATSILTAIYANMSTGSTAIAFSTGPSSVSVQAGLSSDEFAFWSGSNNAQNIAQFQNKLTPLLPSVFWNNLYTLIYKLNDAIDGLNASTQLTPSIKQQLLGEAKFMRAFCFFYLVNMYGDVPLAITTDYKVNSAMPRTPSTDVWKQITIDLKDAKGQLSDNYLNGNVNGTTTERVRPTRWAASALLARVYLYTGDWANAETESNMVIGNTALYDVVSLNNVFLKNSKEAIWQLQPVNASSNTEDGKIFSLSSTPAGPSASKYIYLSATQYNSFEAADQRRTNWVGTYTDATGTYRFPNKYKVGATGASVTEYLMVLRLGELYLIRAEAKARQNKFGEAQADLNVIRTRAGLPNTTAATQSDLITAILHERQTELFSEWGHRWFDLKRTGNVDAVMSVAAASKGTTWNTTAQLYPIPTWDMQKSTVLLQNPGY